MDSISKLQKNALIAKKDSPMHKQMKILFLTQTGRDIAKFNNDIKYFFKSYIEFVDKKKAKYPYNNDKLTDELRSKLLNKNWEKNKLQLYPIHLRIANKFVLESGILFLTAILARYMRLIFYQHDNRLALELIMEIFKEGIHKNVEINLKSLFSKNKSNENEIIENIILELGKNISHYIWEYSPIYNKGDLTLGKDIQYLENELDCLRNSIRLLYGN